MGRVLLRRARVESTARREVFDKTCGWRVCHCWNGIGKRGEGDWLSQATPNYNSKSIELIASLIDARAIGLRFLTLFTVFSPAYV